ncbi:MAG: hypothetical protein SGPRY_002630 [Prymnesium sp.]
MQLLRLMTHVGAAALLLFCARVAESPALIAELLHQAIDASCCTEGMRQLLQALAKRTQPNETISFSRARLPLLIGFSICVLSGGGAVLLIMEAVHAILLSNEASGAITTCAALVPTSSAAVRFLLDGTSAPAQPPITAPERRSFNFFSLSRAVSLSVLLLSDTWPPAQETELQSTRPTGPGTQEALLSTGVLHSLVRHRHAWVAILLCVGAICRAVIGIAEQRVWSLDEHSVVGSFHVMVSWDADGNRIIEELQVVRAIHMLS